MKHPAPLVDGLFFLAPCAKIIFLSIQVQTFLLSFNKYFKKSQTSSGWKRDTFFFFLTFLSRNIYKQHWFENTHFSLQMKHQFGPVLSTDLNLPANWLDTTIIFHIFIPLPHRKNNTKRAQGGKTLGSTFLLIICMLVKEITLHPTQRRISSWNKSFRAAAAASKTAASVR